MTSHNSHKKTRTGQTPGTSKEFGSRSGYVSMFTGLIHPHNSWEPVNDTVMGGRSHARAGFTAAGNLYMHGNLSLENNGGFASIRTRHRLHFAGFHGFRLHVAGDGKRYCLRIKTMNGGQLYPFSYEACFDTSPLLASTGEHRANSETDRFGETDSPSHRQLSDSPGEWVDVPFDLFRPVYRGRKVPDAPPLDPSDIGEVALMIKDRQEGPFRLLVNEIAGYRPPQADEQRWMEVALAEADDSGTPYGAVIVGPDGRIVSKAGNRVGPENDASAHAEIRAIRQAGKQRNSANLSGCRLFSTVEPCPMCMSASIWAGLTEIYYGATIPDVTAAGGKQIDLRARHLALRASDPPALYEGLCREACRQRVHTRV
ncbi:MAG: hypothetical protein EA363_10135 [Balneolaceae bacterium]|nr:MAG: hypothetical protein EA363_10135 [Balneolaceae bacterium]